VRKLYTVAMAWNIDIEAVDAQVDVQVLLSKGECKWGLMEDARGAGGVRGVGGVSGGDRGPVPDGRAARELRLLGTPRGGDAGTAHHLRVLHGGGGDEGVPVDGGHSTDVEPVRITPVV
jgi:hypothetical protein